MGSVQRVGRARALAHRILVAAIVGVVAGAGTVVLASMPAGAHQPIFVTEGAPAESSPLIEDGTVSFAVYGRIDNPGGEVTFRVRHGADQTFAVEVLVPDQPPENERTSFDHVTLTVTDPTGARSEATGNGVLATFDEPFSKTSYLRVLTWTAPAVPGVSTVTVRSEIPTRVTVATGTVERFDGAVSDYEPRPITELATWYATPPASPATTADTDAPGANDDPSADETATSEDGARPATEEPATDEPATSEAAAPLGAPDEDDGVSGFGAAAALAAAAAAAVTAVLLLRRRRAVP